MAPEIMRGKDGFSKVPVNSQLPPTLQPGATTILVMTPEIMRGKDGFSKVPVNSQLIPKQQSLMPWDVTAPEINVHKSIS